MSVGRPNPSAAFDELYDRVQHLPQSNGLDRTEAFARLNEMGVDAFLEFVAKGHLLHDIAIAQEVPVVYLREWVDQFVDAAALDKARELAAEAFVVKSLLPLMVTYDSPGEASVAKALSERMAWVAERLDPGRWGTTRAPAVPNSPVNLVFNIGDAKVEAQAGPQQASVPDKTKTLELLATEVVTEDEVRNDTELA